MSKLKTAVFLLSLILLYRCQNEVLPKPEAALRLQYPNAVYQDEIGDCPYQYKKNKLASIRRNHNCWLQLEYPLMKASVHITYYKVNGNVDSLLRDAQKLTFEHSIKADEIIEQPYINQVKKVYGMFYEVGGNAASPAQFYLTDSTRHFLTGSLYFYTRPNYDSILPAAAYLKKDIRKLIESLEWK